ncbi:MAG TPA: 5-deoxy-glucuronate isomerase [Pyrinomonadaceae bacterium]|jgi:5-deoxy-glucuronate isomerase|nr:5-deoxy-glucuronate isomerase [Pyrinomonadaceae bacterium]
MSQEIEQNPITPETCFVPQTHMGKGRRTAVAPGATAARYLHYGRITLAADDPVERFSSNDHEIGLICLQGVATVTTGGESFQLDLYDAVYVPRDSDIEVKPGSTGCDLAEVSAPVARQYPVKFVSYKDVRQNPKLHLIAGKPPAERDLNVLIGANVEAGRIMAGVTFSTPGNWTSWPPHEHSKLLEEAYLFIDMPAPSFGVQFVYTNPERPELVQVVREGDCVLMPQGYHPNVAAPGGQINFLWMMAAIKEGEDRLYGVVNVQPEYAAGGSGLEAVSDKK